MNTSVQKSYKNRWKKNDGILENSVEDETLRSAVNFEIVSKNNLLKNAETVTNKNDVNAQKLPFETNLLSEAYTTHETERRSTSELESLATHWQLSLHETSHGLLPFQCQDCRISFISKLELEQHSCKVKPGNEQTMGMYKCANCPCEFATSWWLNKHVKAAHQEFAADTQTRLESSTHRTESRDSDYDVDESHETDNESNISDISFESNATIKSGERESNVTINSGERKVETRFYSQMKQHECKSSKPSSGVVTIEILDSDSDVESTIETTDHIDTKLHTHKRNNLSNSVTHRIKRHETEEPDPIVISDEFNNITRKTGANLLLKTTDHIRGHLNEEKRTALSIKSKVRDFDSDIVDASVETADRIDALKCEKCPRAFTFESQLTNHISLEHRSNKSVFLFKCLQCPRRFAFDSWLKNHENAVHQTKQTQTIDGTSLYKCANCPCEFATSWWLNIHVKAAHQELAADTQMLLENSTHPTESRDSDYDVDESHETDNESNISDISFESNATIKSGERDSNTTLKSGEREVETRLQSQLKHVHENTAHLTKLTDIDSDAKVSSQTTKTSDMNPNEAMFRCLLCPREFADSHGLERHRDATHQPALNYLESGTDKTVDSRLSPTGEKPVAHQSETTDELPLRCTQCPRKFASFIWLHRHKNASHHSPKCETPQKNRYPIYKCNYCPRAFQVNQNLLWHVSRVHKTKETVRLVRKEELEPKLKCLKCPLMFKFEKTLAWHNTKIHNIHNNTVKFKRSDCSAPYKCSQCQQKFAKYRLLERHEEMQHKGGKKEAEESDESNATQKLDTDSLYKCEKCPHAFQSNANLVHHASVIHKSFDSDRMDDGTFKCRKCHLDLATKSIYVRHYYKFHKSEWSNVTYACNICTRAFISHIWLQRHISAVHSNGEKLAAHQSEVKNEIRQHGNGSHHSPKCEAPQKNRYPIYKCNYCPRAFQVNQNLLWHVSRVHKTKEKVHLVRKEELEPTLKCLKCPRMFKFEKTLSWHNTKFHNIHNNTVKLKQIDCSAPNKCSQCQQKFATYQLLERHEQTKHKGGKKEAEESDESNVTQKLDTATLYKCEKCPLAFQSIANLVHHASVIHKSFDSDRMDDGTFKCRKCHLDLATKSIYVRHFYKFHKSEWSNVTYACNICTRAFISHIWLQRHISAVHSNGEKLAAHQSEVKNEIWQHGNGSHHSPKCEAPQKNRFAIYKCNYCPRVFRGNQNLLWHISKVHKTEEKGCLVGKEELQPTLKCLNCPRMFKFERSLARHNTNIHSKKLDYPYIYKCEECPRIFKYAGQFKDHFNRVHKIKRSKLFECPQCPRKIKYYTDIKNHEKKAHQTNDQTDDKASDDSDVNLSQYVGVTQKPNRKEYNIFECEECSRIFKYAWQFKDHFNRAHKVKRKNLFECPQCPRKFIYYTGLKNHEENAHQTDDKASDDSDVNLSQYVAVTQKPKRKEYTRILLYKCEECPRIFKYAWRFKDHFNRVHKVKRSKLFKCPQCPRKFINYTGLKNHEEKAHQTNDQTDDKASDDSDVNLSQYTGVTQNPERKEYNIYECEKCPRIFKYAWQFKDHFNRVHKVKRSKLLECSQCPRKFIYYTDIKNHEKRAHKTIDQTDDKASYDSDVNLSQYSKTHK